MARYIKDKPPIGIEPKSIWEETRMLELSKAIQRQFLAGIYTGAVLDWARELKRLLSHYDPPTVGTERKV